VRESVTNILRHAGAGKVAIALEREDGWAVLDISDDGRGGATIRPGHGLSGMRERIAALGGGLEVDSTPEGGGTRVRVRVPAAP
jgi:two-component system sensor histidine kinase DesK